MLAKISSIVNTLKVSYCSQYNWFPLQHFFATRQKNKILGAIEAQKAAAVNRFNMFPLYNTIP